MTPPLRGPGSLLLRLSEWLLDDAGHACVAESVADLQYEIRHADAAGRDRFAARWRGYTACWRLIMTVSLVPTARPLGDRIMTLFLGQSRNRPMALIVAATTLVLWPMLIWFGLGATLAGLATAIALRLWNDRHPTLIAAPEARHRTFDINLAVTPIDGNVGGLFFAVGAIAIVLLGLPGLARLLLACLAGGVGLGAVLFAWRHAHPLSLTYRSSLGLR